MKHLLYFPGYLCLFALQACAPVKIYHAEVGVGTATMAFSTPADYPYSPPALYFRSSSKACELFQIPSESIEHRKPDDEGELVLPVDAASPIELAIVFDSVPSVKDVENSILNGGPANLAAKREIDLNRCEQKITFQPKREQHYEIYFGMNRGACYLRVVEAEKSQQMRLNEFKRVDLLPNNICD